MTTKQALEQLSATEVMSTKAFRDLVDRPGGDTGTTRSPSTQNDHFAKVGNG